MASPSKEESVLKLILENSPLREWHFEEFVKGANVTRAVANKWLKKYVEIGLLKKIKHKNSFPYFTTGKNNPIYYSQKRIYALNSLYESGLISKLISLKEAKTVIIFGSTIRGDWYKDSDIDIFIFGDISNFEKSIYELKLSKHIELHIFQNKLEIKQVRTGLMKNVINGYVIKGGIQDVAEVS